MEITNEICWVELEKFGVKKKRKRPSRWYWMCMEKSRREEKKRSNKHEKVNGMVKWNYLGHRRTVDPNKVKGMTRIFAFAVRRSKIFRLMDRVHLMGRFFRFFSGSTCPHALSLLLSLSLFLSSSWLVCDLFSVCLTHKIRFFFCFSPQISQSSVRDLIILLCTTSYSYSYIFFSFLST